MKKITALILSLCLLGPVLAQKKDKEAKKREKQERINRLFKLEEEGFPSFNRQNAFGGKLNTDGWGLSYEHGISKSLFNTLIFQAEFNVKKHRKEYNSAGAGQPVGGGFVLMGNPFVYGKENRFYQVKLGGGVQRLIGGKGNKNGVSVYGIGAGGLSLGLLRPYYIEVVDNNNTNRTKHIKYDSRDSTQFMSGSAIGGSGLSYGWDEIKMVPGAHAKLAIRFDYNRFNSRLTAIEAGVNGEYYLKDISIMARTPTEKMFFNAYLAILFGYRK